MAEVDDRSRALVRQSLVWDNLLPWVPAVNYGTTDELLPRYRAAGVDLVSLSIAGGAGSGSSMLNTMGRIARVREEIRARADWLVLATSVADIRQAQADGKLAVSFNFQETLPFEFDLSLIQTYYDLGVRQALLAYNQRNLVGDGCAEVSDAGLSRFGVEVVKEMSRVGMLVDGSHSGYRTTMEAMELCEGPFIFSHANPQAIKRHYRNLRDDQITACAATGGVIGINGVGAWIGDVTASTEAVFRCLDYTVELVGPEHVGLGLDYVADADSVYEASRSATLSWPPFEGEELPWHDFAGPERIVELVQLMADHGYPDEAIVGILGENWAGVCERVWKT